MVGFVIWFLVVIIVAAIVIIGVKWLMSVAGITIPQPLLLILGLLMFLVLLFALWHFMGAAALGPHWR